MPLNLSSPINVAQPVNATIINVTQFVCTIDNAGPVAAIQSMQIHYVAGNAVAGVFVPAGGTQTVTQNEAECAALAAADSALLSGIENMVFGLLQQALGVTGTVA